jgi:trigger factor
MRVPGFRKGKVPPRMVIQRAGREAVLDAALREFLPSWYEAALMSTAIAPVGDPKLSVETLPGPGEPLAFSFEVAVRPKAKLGEYRGLEVGRAEAEAPAEAVDAEIERLREGFARLESVERAAGEGDFVTIDYRGEIDGEAFDGGEASDYMVELGRGTLLEDLESGLTGAAAGDERDIPVSFPEDYGAEQVAGKDAVFKVTVKDVREKHLPQLDDDFASEASEFETLAELRDEIGRRVSEAVERQADSAFRDAALDAAADAAEIELPDEVVQGRAEEMFERFQRTLERQGIGAEAYLRMSGKTREELIADSRTEAERSLRREATLVAVAEAEGIEVGDDEMLEALRPAGDGDGDPAQVLERLKETGRDAMLREELRMRKAAELIADSAKPIPLEQAAAREKIWTPEKEREEQERAEGAGDQGQEAKPGGLWTPGDPS